MASRTIHPSLVRPQFFGGVPRKYAIVNWTGVAILVNWTFQSHLWVLLGLSLLGGFAVHAFMAYATKKDEKSVEAYFRHIKYQKYYPARAHPDAPATQPKYFRIGS